MKTKWILAFFACVLLLAIGFAWHLLSVYTSVFGNAWPPATSRGDWGVMGDFFGGVLNPLFSILGLLMLLVTLIQNQRELELSRRELSESNKALAAQATTLEKQRFEDTFFAILDQLNRSSEKILSDDVRYDAHGTPSRSKATTESAAEFFFGSARAKPRVRIGITLNEAKNELLKFDPLLNQYFRVLYQLLKLIATNSPGTSLTKGFTNSELKGSIATDTEKFYSNLVRAFLPETIYYLLAINCHSEDETDSYYSYKLLVERYAFFEHMPINLSEHQHVELMGNILLHYKADAFGKNPAYKSKRLGLNAPFA